MIKINKRVFGMVMAVFICIVVIVVTMVAYMDTMDYRIQQMENERNNAVELYLESIKKQIQIGTDRIWTRNLKLVSLDVLTSKGPRLCLYIHKSQCDLCRNEAFDYLKESGNLYKGLNPIVLLSDFKPNDLKQMGQSCTLPLFLVDERMGKDVDIRRDYPVLFVLNPNGTMNYVFPLEDKSPYIKEEYMKKVNAYCQMMNRKPKVRAINTNIQLGNIRLRRKAVVNLIFENVSNQDCKIVDIEQSCDCIGIEDFTKVIKAESRGFVKVTLVPERKGTLYRTVSVIMANGETADFEIVANVV